MIVNVMEQEDVLVIDTVMVCQELLYQDLVLDIQLELIQIHG
jgi:hypothetical protein